MAGIYLIIFIIVNFFASSLIATTQLCPDIDKKNLSDFGHRSQCNYKERWFYTLDEIKTIYEMEYNEGKRLHNHIIIDQGKTIANCGSTKIEIPDKFINCTQKHLKEMLKKGYAKYIFRLDACHGHLFVPNDTFWEEYKNHRPIDVIRAIMKDENAGVLYHNAEHLALRKPPITGKIDPLCAILRNKRNVIGWYDRRPMALTYPKPSDSTGRIKANTAGVPEGYCSAWTITFKANKNGEFIIRHDGKTIRIDISICNFYYY